MRLSSTESADMVAKVTGGRTLPPEVLDQIVAKTDGVPLFVEELTTSVIESDLVREQDGRYVLIGQLPAHGAASVGSILYQILSSLQSIAIQARAGGRWSRRRRCMHPNHCCACCASRPAVGVGSDC